MTCEGPPGPAPDGASRSFETVETDLVPVDAPETGAVRARFQPWVDSGGIFVAWAVDAETGHLGTAAFPAEAAWPDSPPVADAHALVWLGERGSPVGDGRYRDWVALAGESAGTLREGVRDARGYLQSPSAGLAPLAGVERSEPAVTAERAEKLADPAPNDAAAVGDRYAFRVFWWGPRTVGVCQAWRPHRGASAYVAWSVAPPVPETDAVDTFDTLSYGGTLDRGTHGVISGNAPSLYLGRRPSMRWVYFFHPDTADAFDGLVTDVCEFRPDEPSAGFRTAP